MPSALVKSFAKKSGHSVADIERYWDEAKASAKDKGLDHDSPSFWKYVSGIVQRRAGLREGLSFSEFLLLEELKSRVSMNLDS